MVQVVEGNVWGSVGKIHVYSYVVHMYLCEVCACAVCGAGDRVVKLALRCKEYVQCEGSVVGDVCG